MKTPRLSVSFSTYEKRLNRCMEGPLDMGITHGKPSKKLGPQVLTTRASSSRHVQNLFEIEKQLVKDLNEKGSSAYDDLLPNDVRFLRSGSGPLTTKVEIERYLNISATGAYLFTDGEVSSTHDLAFTYGSVTFTDNADTNKRLIRSYTRLWKRERDGWKIIVDLLSG